MRGLPSLAGQPASTDADVHLFFMAGHSNRNTVRVDLEEPAYKNPRLALWSGSKNGLGWLGLTLARASKNIQASLGWRKNRQC